MLKTKAVQFTTTQAFRNVIKRALPAGCRLIHKGFDNVHFVWEVRYPPTIDEAAVIHALDGVECVAGISVGTVEA